MPTSNINNAYKHSDITSRIIASALEVHTVLGNGFQEVIYQRALAIEMKERWLAFVREQEMELRYKGRKIGTRRVDFFVEHKIMVEIKAITQIENVHLAQAINYLEAYNLEVGLLMNFGSKSLDVKRVMKKRS
jgi:GxxExxY protein